MIPRLLLALAAIPLVIYPGVLMGCIMGLAAEQTPNANPLTLMVAKTFLWSLLLYPVGYLAAVGISFKSPRVAAVFAVLHLSLCGLLFAAWLLLERLK